MVELTPIEEHDGYRVKRDDLYRVAGVGGGKARTSWHLAQDARGLVTAGARSSPQVNIVAHIAKELGIHCHCHVPEAKGDLTPELKMAAEAGAEIIGERPGHHSVIIKRARDNARARGWRHIPFGMECPEATRMTAEQVANVPSDTKRIIVPAGSGMSLTGILWGLDDCDLDIPVIGVRVGTDPVKQLDRYAPSEWRSMCQLVVSDYDYHEEAEVDFPITLDPIYEAKCVEFLEDGDLLWVVGLRESLARGQTDA